MPRLTTTRDLRLDHTIRVDEWFQLDLERDGSGFAQYRIKIGHTYIWVRDYGTLTEVYKVEVGQVDADYRSTTWPVGLEQLNGPKRVRRTKAETPNAKRRRRPKRSK